jgi:hypothetical protein
MLNRLTVRFVARVLILSLIFGAFGAFNAGSILAAKNRAAETQTSGAQDGNSQSKTTGAQDGNSQLNGQLIANGSVTVNGNKAITGTTVFTDSRIVVDSAKGNSAIVNLGKLGRIELVAGSKLLLRFSDGLISGELEEGNAVVKAPAGVKVAINALNQAGQASGGQQPVKVVVVHDTIAVPSATAPPVPAQIPGTRRGGVGGWGLAGGLLGAGGVTAAAIAAAGDDDNDLIAGVVSPVAP